MARSDVRSLSTACIGDSKRGATLPKTEALRPATLGPMDTIASRLHLILIECAVLAVFTVGAYLMVALLPV
jgi:hypothetical protein